MIRLVMKDFARAIQLLEGYNTCEVVGERNPSKTDALLGTFAYARGYTIAAADDKHDMGDSFEWVILENASQIFARDKRAFDIAQDNRGIIPTFVERF